MGTIIGASKITESGFYRFVRPDQADVDFAYVTQKGDGTVQLEILGRREFLTPGIRGCPDYQFVRVNDPEFQVQSLRQTADWLERIAEEVKLNNAARFVAQT